MELQEKCGNPDCAVPAEGYPSGRNLIAVREQWNRRVNDKEDSNNHEL